MKEYARFLTVWGLCVLAGFGLVHAPAQAAVVGCSASPSSSVTITSITKTADGTPVYSSSAPSIQSLCYEFTQLENDDGGLSSPSPNIGHLYDGLLNGKLFELNEKGTKTTSSLNPSVIVDESYWYDVPGNDALLDPGWIHLANLQEKDDNLKDITYSTSTVSIAPDGKPFSELQVLEIDKLLKIDFTCSIVDGKSNCASGTWSLKVFPDTVDAVGSVLGRNIFDHLAFVFKAGNPKANDGPSVRIYDFDFNLIVEELKTLAGGGPLDFDFETAYTLSGNWNMNDFGGKKVSHINVWARDPAIKEVSVPIPAPLALLLFGGAIPLLMRGHRRRAAAASS